MALHILATCFDLPYFKPIVVTATPINEVGYTTATLLNHTAVQKEQQNKTKRKQGLLKINPEFHKSSSEHDTGSVCTARGRETTKERNTGNDNLNLQLLERTN